MKKIVAIISCLLILFAFISVKTSGEPLKTNESDFVIINNQKVFLNVADTEDKKVRGLMFIEKLSENQGMIFLYKKSDYATFWMKNMMIPLDIVFVSNGKIAKIYKEVPACKQEKCPLYDSRYRVDSVIELKKGFCDKYKVKTGDKIIFSENIKIRQAKLRET